MSQRPQCVALVCVSTHASPQRVKPVLQVKPHAPAAQVAVPFAGAGQTIPQRPQCMTVVLVSVSQPLAAFMSQLPKPALQVPSPHMPPTQAAAAFVGAGQTLLHVPQFIMLVWRSVQVPLQEVCPVGQTGASTTGTSGVSGGATPDASRGASTVRPTVQPEAA